jgi:glycosyltransferase involved in cell wall biosynthesis
MITIVTPTYRRSGDVLRRCLDSVNGQGCSNWKQIVIVDSDTFEGHVSQDILQKYSNEKRKFILAGKEHKNYANTPRQMCIELCDTEYIMFLDDDNIIFPNCVEVFLKGFAQHQTDCIIAPIFHCGPLPMHLGPPPIILRGNPPVVKNIDTLNICVKTEAMKKCGWCTDKGYCADGYTFEMLCQTNSYSFLQDIIGVHF